MMFFPSFFFENSFGKIGAATQTHKAKCISICRSTIDVPHQKTKQQG